MILPQSQPVGATPPLAVSAVLGQTSAHYVGACRAASVSGGEPGALRRYQELFRRGITTDPLLPVCLPEVSALHRTESDEGEVLKFLLRVPGGASLGRALETESVLIPMIGRKGTLSYSLCMSSQVGCAMGCTFCQTAQMGLVRSLTAAEIVAQWFIGAHALGTRARNIVFMGMGEPMDNLDAVCDAIAVLTDHHGPAVPMSRIVVSTVGRIDGLRKLAERVRRPGWHRLGLAVSLNAPNDDIRSSIMPVNRGMPMRELRAVLVDWPIHGGAKICLEYVLIPGVNDSPEHGGELAEFVRGLPAMVNVIPYNPREGSPWPAPEEESITAFLRTLVSHGVYCKRRRTKGRETMSACGQLGNLALKRTRAPAARALIA